MTLERPIGRVWVGAAVLLAAVASNACATAPASATADAQADALAWGDLDADYLKLHDVELGPGVHALLGRGGNSLIVFDDGDASHPANALVFDTKFGTNLFTSGASSLRDWVAAHVAPKVGVIVDSHAHYDHTFGNSLFPNANVFAREGARARMLAVDSEMWGTESNPLPGLPTDSITGVTTIAIGRRTLEAHAAPRAHTAFDAWLRVPKEAFGGTHDVIATGDLMFATYFPFFDEDPIDGSSIAGNSAALRELARDFPDAVFMPGHGPMATASDLAAYADYLDDVLATATDAVAAGLDEDAAVAQVRPADKWHRLLLPSPHHGLSVATADSSFRSAYRLVRAGAASTL